MKKWIKIALVCVAIAAVLTVAFLAAPSAPQPAPPAAATTEYTAETVQTLELGLPVLGTTTAEELYSMGGELIIQQTTVATTAQQATTTMPTTVPPGTEFVTLSITGLDGAEILPPIRATWGADDTVFTLLQREARARNIPVVHVGSPLLGTVYIRGIAGLFEFDHGELSGWVYRVNGEFAGIGVCRWQLQRGDVVELIFTTEMISF